MGLLAKFKKGGGFLHNVDGLVVGYSFTTQPDFGGDREQPERKEGDFTALWCALTVRTDGSEANETTHLFAGSGDDFVISEDGLSLEPVNNASLWGNTAFAQFYESLVQHGVEDVDIEDGEPLNFGHIIGARVRFVQEKDEEAMKRAAKGAAKSRGRINAQGQKKGKDGKFYDIRTLRVSEVYSTGNTIPTEGKPSGGSKTAAAAKPAAKAVVKGRPSQTAAAQAAATDGSIAEFAEDTLVEILGKEKGKKISKTKMNLAVTRALPQDDRREDVRKYLYDDTNLEALAERGVITYDKASKEQTIALPAA